jgi:hypothetical protein
VSKPATATKSNNPWHDYLKFADGDPGPADSAVAAEENATSLQPSPVLTSADSISAAPVVQTQIEGAAAEHTDASQQQGGSHEVIQDVSSSKPPFSIPVPEIIVGGLQDDVRTQNATSDAVQQNEIAFAPSVLPGMGQEAPKAPESPKLGLNISSIEVAQTDMSGSSDEPLTAEDSVSELKLPDSSTDPAPTPIPKIEEDEAVESERETISGFDEVETCNCGNAQPGKDECYFCWPCNGTIFCKKCWDKCPPHKGKLLGSRQVGVPHEKSDPMVARRIFETLQSDRDAKEQARLHDQDEDTSWFGTGKDSDTGETVFRDFGRYSRLVEELSSRRRLTRFPALVSFVGQTGAGKSSLIRLLVETLAPLSAAPEVPVVGSTLHSDVPTSGDVHLYPDLTTFETNQPIFYADCEGLDGGERQPQGARRNKAPSPNPRTQSFTKHIRKQHHTSEREITWANTPLTTSREYHVRHLYPRLLFTFSDCIVFVMKNPRVIEGVIEQLIDWAAAALETSSNQPVLPHAIIVLNATDSAADPDLWDVNNSTIDLLRKVDRAVHQNHKLRKFAEFWREKGRQIETVETLLLSYYSSIRVVRMPEKGRPTLIHDQVSPFPPQFSSSPDHVTSGAQIVPGSQRSMRKEPRIKASAANAAQLR